MALLRIVVSGTIIPTYFHVGFYYQYLESHLQQYSGCFFPRVFSLDFFRTRKKKTAWSLKRVFFWHRQEKPDNKSREKRFLATVNRGADLLSTHPTQEWRFTPLHQAAYAGNLLIIRRLINLLQHKQLLQANLRTESHPRGLGDHGYPVELARNSSEVAMLLRNASEWKYRRSMTALMLCIASHNASALTAQVRAIHTLSLVRSRC